MIHICRLDVPGTRSIHLRLQFVDQVLLYPNSTIFVVELALCNGNKKIK